MRHLRIPKRLLYLEGWIIWVLVFAAFFTFAILASAGCAALTSQHKAESVLTNVGYSNIHGAKREWFMIELKGCGQDDQAQYIFKATNPIGKTVTVKVCEGFFKGATIRGTE